MGRNFFKNYKYLFQDNKECKITNHTLRFKIKRKKKKETSLYKIREIKTTISS